MQATNTLLTSRTRASDPPIMIHRRLPVGWARIRLKMSASIPGLFKLFGYAGKDPAPSNCLMKLEVVDALEVDRFVYIDRPINGLSIDAQNGPNQFQLEFLRIDSLSSFQALRYALTSKIRLLRKYAHTRQALGRALGMLARGDFSRLRGKLFQGLNGPDLEGREPYDETQAYNAWRLSRRLTDRDRANLRAEAAALAAPPRFSILLALTGKPEHAARRSIESVLRQTYPFWDLCISCDEMVKAAAAEYACLDPRIRFTEASTDLNAALASASGDYTTLLWEGDELAEHALSKLSQSIVADPGLDMLYADEDRLTPDGAHVAPHFKPEWSPESLLAWMYIGRSAGYRTALVRELGGFRSEYNPAHEYDLALRLAVGSLRVRRVPDVLYHRRTAPPPSADEAARQALQNHLDETNRKGSVEPGPAFGLSRVHFTTCGSPLISIIIASACRRVRIRGEQTYYLLKCLESIQKSSWPHFEIIVLHGPMLPPILARRLERYSILHAEYEKPFNWSMTMNQGAALAHGEHLLFLNDDVEVITPDWLEQLIQFSQQSAVGAVGAKLFFPGGRIQHAGVAVLDGRPQHPFYAHNGEHSGYFNNLLVPRNCSAVTGACLMTRADVFHPVGRFDETLPLNYNDVDYCLKLIASGRRVVCTPYARLYHHELGTRPAKVRPEETETLQKRWVKLWANDPYYNPNLSTSHFDYRIRWVKEESAGRHGTQ